MTKKRGDQMTNDELDAAVEALLKSGPKRRIDICETLDIADVDIAHQSGMRLIAAGRATAREDDEGFATFTLLEHVPEEDPAEIRKVLPTEEQLAVEREKNAAGRKPSVGWIEAAAASAEVDAAREETRSVPDRRLLRRITPERRAEIDRELADLSREEAEVEGILAATKERLKALHEKHMLSASLSRREDEYADVPCKEVVRFAAGEARIYRCDDPAEWPAGTPEDGFLDVRALDKSEMQETLPGVEDESPAAMTEVQRDEKRRGRPKGSKNKAKGEAVAESAS